MLEEDYENQEVIKILKKFSIMIKSPNYAFQSVSNKGKNILFISDNFGDSKYNHFASLKTLVEDSGKYKLFIADRFSRINKEISFDAVFIDYGFIDNCFNTLNYCLNKITDFYSKGIILVWCGGLPAKYNDDSKILFPKLTYLHNLEVCHNSYDEILFTLDKIFFKCGNSGIGEQK